MMQLMNNGSSRFCLQIFLLPCLSLQILEPLRHVSSQENPVVPIMSLSNIAFMPRGRLSSERPLLSAQSLPDSPDIDILRARNHLSVMNIASLTEDVLKEVLLYLEGHEVANLFLASPTTFQYRLQASTIRTIAFHTGQCSYGPLNYRLKCWPTLVSRFQALKTLIIDLGEETENSGLTISVADLDNLPSSLVRLEMRFRVTLENRAGVVETLNETETLVPPQLSPLIFSRLISLQLLSITGNILDFMDTSCVLPPALRKFVFKPNSPFLNNFNFVLPSTLTDLEMHVRDSLEGAFLANLPEQLTRLSMPLSDISYLGSRTPPFLSRLNTLRFDSCTQFPPVWLLELSPVLVNLAIGAALLDFIAESHFALLPRTLESLTLSKANLEPKLMHLLPPALTYLELGSATANVSAALPSSIKILRFPATTSFTAESFAYLPQDLEELDLSTYHCAGEEAFPLLPDRLKKFSTGCSVTVFDAAELPRSLESLTLSPVRTCTTESTAIPLLPRSLTSFESSISIDATETDITGFPPELTSLTLTLNSMLMIGDAQRIRLSGLASLSKLRSLAIISGLCFSNLPVFICRRMRPRVKFGDSIEVDPSPIREDDSDAGKRIKFGFQLPSSLTALNIRLRRLPELIQYIPNTLLQLDITPADDYNSEAYSSALKDFLPRSSLRFFSLRALTEPGILDALPPSATVVQMSLAEDWIPGLQASYPRLRFLCL